MSPVKKAMNDLKEEGPVWSWLFKLGLMCGPFVIMLMAWLVSQAFASQAFRDRGGRVTLEQHIEFKEAVEARLLRIENKYETIHGLLLRVDETTKSMKEDVERLREERE